MKAKDILTKNKDLDLRRYGKHEYSSKSGGGDSAYNELVSKEWMRVRIEDIDTYKKLISGEGGGGITPTMGPLPIKLKVDYENIPEGSTKVAICSGEDVIYAFGLTNMEASAYKYNNLYLIPDDIPTNAVLTVKKSQRQVGEGAEAYTEDVFELLDSITRYSLETNLDLTDSNTFSVGGWVPVMERNPLDTESSYIWDQLTEDKIVTGDDLDWLVVDKMAPSERIQFYIGYISNVIKDNAEKVYNVGRVYLAKLEITIDNFKIPVLVPLKKSSYS